eukprot:10877081-Lingulodinium_polyedra.AAC.1
MAIWLGWSSVSRLGSASAPQQHFTRKPGSLWVVPGEAFAQVLSTRFKACLLYTSPSPRDA